MTYHGKSFGIRIFETMQMRWFTDYAEAEACEKIEVAKFIRQDREREAARLKALGIQAERPPSYTILLRDEQPEQKRKRLR